MDGHFLFLLHRAKIRIMGQSERLTPALKKALEEGIDLSQLYERLSWTPTERIQKNLQMLNFANEKGSSLLLAFKP